jgi:hypothetical protein
MREYRKRKRLEGNCSNVPRRRKLHAERQREYRETHKSYLLDVLSDFLKELLDRILATIWFLGEMWTIYPA